MATDCLFRSVIYLDAISVFDVAIYSKWGSLSLSLCAFFPSFFTFQLQYTLEIMWQASEASYIFILTLSFYIFFNYCQFLPWVCNQPSASWQPAPVSSVSQCFQWPSFCACKWHRNPHEVLFWHLQNLWCSGDSTSSSMLRIGQFQHNSSRLTSFMLAIKKKINIILSLFWCTFE